MLLIFMVNVDLLYKFAFKTAYVMRPHSGKKTLLPVGLVSKSFSRFFTNYYYQDVKMI